MAEGIIKKETGKGKAALGFGAQLIPAAGINSGLRDNHKRGTVANFLASKIGAGSELSIVSAYFTIYAATLVDRLVEGAEEKVLQDGAVVGGAVGFEVGEER